MAHKGRAYKYAERRDLSITTTPMQWLPVRYSPDINNLYSTVTGNVFTTLQPSHDYIIDADAGTYTYNWDPVSTAFGTMEWQFIYELTFDQDETKTTHRMALDGVWKEVTRLGRQLTLFRPTGPQIFFPYILGFIVWFDSSVRADRWRSGDNT